MKKLTIIMLALYSFNSTLSYSQQINQNKLKEIQAKHSQILSGLLQHQQSANSPAMKSTAVKERVIKKIFYDYTNWQPNDSFYIKYSGQRGSTFDYNQMDYQFYQFPGYLINTNVNSSDRLVKYDTALRYSQNTSKGTFFLNERTAIQYNNNGSDTNFYHYVNGNPIIYKDRYNSLNLLMATYLLNDSVTSIDSLYKEFYVYDASNKVIADSTYTDVKGVWSLTAYDKYKYDAANNMTEYDSYAFDGTTWTQSYKMINVFNASNQLLYDYWYYNFDTSLAIFTIDTFTYTTGIVFPITWKEYNFYGGHAEWGTYITKTLNAQGLPDTTYEYFWQPAKGFYLNTQSVISYDSFDNPVSILTYIDSTGTPFAKPITANYYYYEQYTTTNVLATKQAAADIRIYPNPAKDQVYIHIPDGVYNSSHLTAAIININGQVLLRQQLSPATTAINIDKLSAGTYIIVVSKENGEKLSAQTIIKK